MGGSITYTGRKQTAHEHNIAAANVIKNPYEGIVTALKDGSTVAAVMQTTSAAVACKHPTKLAVAAASRADARGTSPLVKVWFGLCLKNLIPSQVANEAAATPQRLQFTHTRLSAVRH